MWIKINHFPAEAVTISKAGGSVWFVCLISETNSYGQQNNYKCFL